MKATRNTPIRQLWLAVLCGYLAFGATLQQLPGYVVTRFHQGPLIAGLCVGIAYAATALHRPLAGRVSDAGFAKQVVLIGSVTTAVAAVGHLLAPNIGVLMFARVVMGAGEAALFSGALPWVLAGTPADRSGRVAGWFGLSMWAGLAGGPLLAVFAAHLGGNTAVWWLVVVLPLPAGILVVSAAPQTKPNTTAGIRPTSVRDLLPARVGLPGLSLGLAAYGYGTLWALLVLYLAEHRIGGQNVALAVFAAAFLVTRAVGSPLVDRYGGIRVARFMLTIETMGLLLLTMLTTAPLILADTAICGIGVGLIYPATVAITLRRTGAESPGFAVGTMTSYWDLGIFFAGPIGGLIATRLGYPEAFAVAAAMAGIALAATFALRGRPSTVGKPGIARQHVRDASRTRD